MAVRGKKLKYIPALGVDQRWKQELGSAEDIANARVDTEGLGWLFDRGVEPWWDPGNSLTVTATVETMAEYLQSSIDSCYVWSKQNTEQTYFLIEQAGRLYYFWGNKGSSASNTYFNDYIEIANGRHIPSANEPGTQYIPFGNRLLIINGYDKPIWFYGRNKGRNFSFTFPTPAAEVLDIETKYLAGLLLENGICSPSFSQSSNYGLGQIDQRNHYNWKISFITDSGSESPLSPLSVVDWINGTDAAEEVKLGVFIKDLPIGPEGTVARRIYRTKNQKNANVSGAADAVYYFVKQINENCSESFIDVISDGNLVDEAPSQIDSSIISGAYQYAANWNGSIWMAGGTPHPTKIIYSKPGLPEQFGASDYFELGNTAGGAITGIYPYYNNLIIFRQRAIDMIRITSQGYTVSQLSPEIGTEATNTIKFVPGFGVIFLSYDNVYIVNGGTEGGSVVEITKISQKIGKELERLNKGALQRSVAVYSNKEKEYWIHIPVDGNKYNSRGLVFHTDTAQWSLRHAVDDAADDYFRFASMAVDTEGNIIIGPSPIWRDGGSGSSVGDVDAYAFLPGLLHVWSGVQYWGKKITSAGYSGLDGTWNFTPNSIQGRRWESSWIDFGDSSLKHRVFSVEVEILSMGNTDLELSWGQDYDYSFTSAGTQKMNRPETVLTSSEDAVFGPSSSEAKNFYEVGTSLLQDGRVTTLRWDVNTKLVQNFKFRLDSSSNRPFHIVSFHIDYSDGSQKTLNQNARNNSKQPY